jgi:hypothetical protein
VFLLDSARSARASAGWRAELDSTPEFFIYGQATPAAWRRSRPRTGPRKLLSNAARAVP